MIFIHLAMLTLGLASESEALLAPEEPVLRRAQTELVLLGRGPCRTAQGGTGRFQHYQASIDQCRSWCENNSQCTAMEYWTGNGSDAGCYLHYDPITYVQPDNQARCEVKQQMQPMPAPMPSGQMGTPAPVPMPVSRTHAAALTTKLTMYPGFNGNARIEGTVSMSIQNGMIKMSYDLSGLPYNAFGGLHIHEGYTCSDASLVGGHHYNQHRMQDPWANTGTTTWHSGRNGYGQNSFMINSGYNTVNDNLGRAIVVHLPDGTRAACGVLQPLETLTADLTTNFQHGSPVRGAFTLSESDHGLTVSYRLNGLSGNQGGQVTIHEEASCQNVGGRYTNTFTENVWNSNNYGDAVGSFYFNTGRYDTLDNHIGHVMVVYYQNGQPAACGKLEALPALGARLGRYPGYNGRARISGDILISVDSSGDLRLTYSLFGLENNVMGGIHIHEGTSCDTKDGPGGHYWNQRSYGNHDPWESMKYQSDYYGRSRNSFLPHSGYESVALNANHVVVVHLQDGTRAACGVLKEIPQAFTSYLGNYPDYHGNAMIRGTVTVNADPSGHLDFQGSLNGLMPWKSGGFHIHQGVDCHVAANVGGHFYDKKDVARYSMNGEDPWTRVKYHANGQGQYYGTVPIDTGYNSWVDNLGRATVVHLPDDTRAACGVLKMVCKGDRQ